jgi:hypothetical protein
MVNQNFILKYNRVANLSLQNLEKNLNRNFLQISHTA